MEATAPVAEVMQPDDILHCITVYAAPHAPVRTIRGVVPFDVWLQHEYSRIVSREGWPLAISRNAATGEISLVHRRISLMPVIVQQTAAHSAATLSEVSK